MSSGIRSQHKGFGAVATASPCVFWEMEFQEAFLLTEGRDLPRARSILGNRPYRIQTLRQDCLRLPKSGVQWVPSTKRERERKVKDGSSLWRPKSVSTSPSPPPGPRKEPIRGCWKMDTDFQVSTNREGKTPSTRFGKQSSRRFIRTVVFGYNVVFFYHCRFYQEVSGALEKQILP